MELVALVYVMAPAYAANMAAAFAKFWPGWNRPISRRWLGDHKTVAGFLLGVAAEGPLTGRIRELCPAAIDIAGRTGFADIAALARNAACALGNDTGPMHLIAATGCPSVVLFSAESDPALCAPRGPRVTALRRDPLAGLDPGDVLGALRALGVVS